MICILFQRYKPEVRSIKPTQNREYQVPSTPVTHEPTERILRNGKRRGSSIPITPTSTTKANSFKIPSTPPSTKIDEKLVDNNSNNVPSIGVNDEDDTNSMIEEKNLIRNIGDDETGDNCSSRSISPTTSGTSTTSSSPPLSNNMDHQSSSIPIDLSNSKTMINEEQETKDSLIPYHFINDMLFSSPANSSGYFPSPPPPPQPQPYLHGSTNSFSLPLHSTNNTNKRSATSSAVSPSSYLPIPSQLYFNSLTIPHYSSVSSLSKSSH
jgi:hypothetical protein